MTFEQFLSPLFPLFKAITENHGLDSNDSTDAIQEATLSLWKRFSSGELDLTKNTKAYALQLINWRAKDFWREKKRRGELFSIVGEDNDLDSLAQPEIEEKKKFPLKILSFAKKKLSKRDYLIFIDHLRGVPVKNTAEKFGLDNSMVYMVRCRSLKKIRQYDK